MSISLCNLKKSILTLWCGHPYLISSSLTTCSSCITYSFCNYPMCNLPCAVNSPYTSSTKVLSFLYLYDISLTLYSFSTKLSVSFMFLRTLSSVHLQHITANSPLILVHPQPNNSLVLLCRLCFYAPVHQKKSILNLWCGHRIWFHHLSPCLYHL